MTRKMPAHIVLPNGMWRFVKKGSKSGGSRRKSVRKMAKKGYHKAGGMNYKRIAAGLLLGVGAAALTGRKEVGAIAGFALGGLPAAAGGYFAGDIAKMLQGVTNSAAGTGGQLF